MPINEIDMTILYHTEGIKLKSAVAVMISDLF
jgi:hypothetical protein